MKKDKLFIEQVKSKISKVDIVSFDIFDTLLVRPYVRPTDLFLHMEKAYERPGFSDERRDAERRTRIRHPELEDITFDMIYAEIDEEFKDMKQKEMDWEEMVLRANPELKQVYDYAKEQGKKIIIASDMYLPTEFIAKVLRKNGYDGWDKLYVSGDLGKKKRSGSLYYHMLEEIKTAPQNILHIGDNIEVDYNVAKVIGFTAQPVECVVQQYTRHNIKAQSFYNQVGNYLGSSILISVLAYRWQKQRCNKEVQDYWDELGYQYSGPLAYSFMRWLATEIQNSDIEHLLFVMRSGYVLKKVFDTFKPEIQTSYVYAPRVLKAVCDLSIDYKDDYIKFIEYFVNKNEEIKQRYSAVKDKSYDNLKLFFNVNKKLFEEQATKNWGYYLKYMEGVCSKNEKIALVDDMAANFSAQILLEKATGKEVPSFYFATANFQKFEYIKRQTFAETYTTRKLKCQEADVWTWKWRFVEFLMGAPEVPVSDVNEKGIVFIDKPGNQERLRCKLSQNMVNNAVLFAEEIKTLFKGADIFIEFPVIVKWINCFLNFPQKNDYKQMMHLSCDWKTFNTDSLDFLVKQPRLREFFVSVDKYKRGINGTFFWPSQRHGILYDKVERENITTIKILGLPFYSKKVVGEITKIKKCFGLIKIYKDLWRKKIYVLGIRIHKKKINRKEIDYNKILNAVNSFCHKSIAVSKVNTDTFLKYKNLYADKTAVIVATGPSAKFYQSLLGTVNIGVNKAFKLNDISLDYLFMQDYISACDWIEGTYNLKCKKFIGIFLDRLNPGYAKRQIPESYINDLDAERYYTCPNRYAFEYDITSFPLKDTGTVVHPALQFALWSGFKKIYLVGCDTTNAGYFDNSKPREELACALVKKGYQALKDFAAHYYPETEIISVNPVGLKGLFHDVYTKSYLAKHPEIDAETVEILEEKE